jgi:glycosyltransferase involved in cell wall biosynthesis
MASPISVIVPAHDERLVIERCLQAVLTSNHVDDVELLVVCNGCHDGTPEVARAVSPRVHVIETPVASKHHALNLGDEHASGDVKVFLDADTVVSEGALDAVADLLGRPGILVAAPEIRFDVSACTWPARQFHRVWSASPYFEPGLVGAGFYALGPEGRRRFDRFPPIVADDGFIQALFAPSERATAHGHTFTPLLPTTLRAMYHVHLRHYGASAELDRWWAEHRTDQQVGASVHSKAWVFDLVRDPANWPGLVLFGLVKVAARIVGPATQRRRGMGRWKRDDVSRRAAA